MIKEIRNVRKHIRGTISERNIVYIEDVNTSYQMLKALKKRLAPTDYARKIEVANDYAKVKHFNKRQKVEDHLAAWEKVFSEAKSLNLPDVAEDRSQLDFTQAIRQIDASYASTQDFHISQKIRTRETLPSLYDLIEDFRNNYRRVEASKDTNSGSHPAVGTHQGQSQEKKYICFCGGEHRFDDCYYINSSKRPKGWKGKADVFEKISTKLDATSPSWVASKKLFFLKKYNYNSEAKDGSAATSKPMGYFVTSSLHTSLCNSQDKFKLYNCWTLDGASDIHVCNNATRSDFTETREAGPNDLLFAGKGCYQIEAFGTTKVWVNTPNGKRHIELLNVALAPGFMNNLVSLEILLAKDVHWETKKPDHLQYTNGKVFCRLQTVDRHWVLESSTAIHSSFSTKTSKDPRHVKFTEAEMHGVLAHASSEAVSHVKDAAVDITIDPSVPCPSTIQCATCSTSKATEIVSRRTEVEDAANEKPFDRITYDLIPLETGYNGDEWLSHFHCTASAFNLVFTQRTKSESTAIVEEAINLIGSKYGMKVQFICTDGETSLGGGFDSFVMKRGIQVERSALGTQAQNGDSERAGRTMMKHLQCQAPQTTRLMVTMRMEDHWRDRFHYQPSQLIVS